MTLSDAPPNDVVEVSLFGPGKGESCLIHLGNAEWLIVDSCRSQRTGSHPILQYLQRIGVDIGTQVRMIVATHAHDDHIAGLAELIEACTTAEFVCPEAASREEFFALLKADEEMAYLVRPSAFSEYRKIFETLELRSAPHRPKIKRALESRLLLRRLESVGVPAVAVTALSPSDEAVTRAVERFAQLLIAEQTDRRRVASGDPNTFSAALWVEVGEVRVLLGADLLKGPGPRCGWNAVLASTTRPPGKASLYKVAHHGSPTSEHPGIWSDLLEAAPVAVLAPFRGSQTPRPSPEDVARLCATSGGAYATARTKVPSPPKAVKSTAARLGAVVRNVRDPNGTPGQIRARSSGEGVGWTIELASPALSLC